MSLLSSESLTLAVPGAGVMFTDTFGLAAKVGLNRDGKCILSPYAVVYKKESNATLTTGAVINTGTGGVSFAFGGGCIF